MAKRRPPPLGRRHVDGPRLGVDNDSIALFSGFLRDISLQDIVEYGLDFALVGRVEAASPGEAKHDSLAGSERVTRLRVQRSTVARPDGPDRSGTSAHEATGGKHRPVVHRRMDRRVPRHDLQLHLLAEATAEATCSTGIGDQFPLVHHDGGYGFDDLSGDTRDAAGKCRGRKPVLLGPGSHASGREVDVREQVPFFVGTALQHGVPQAS